MLWGLQWAWNIIFGVAKQSTRLRTEDAGGAHEEVLGFVEGSWKVMKSD